MATLTTFALAAALATPSATPLPKLAVLRLKALDPSVATDTELLVEVILADLAASHRVDAIGASDIEAMLGVERQRQLLGCSDNSSSCLAELGGALGAEYILVGTLAKLERSKRLDVKLLDTRTNRVVFRGFASAS